MPLKNWMGLIYMDVELDFARTKRGNVVEAAHGLDQEVALQVGVARGVEDDLPQVALVQDLDPSLLNELKRAVLNLAQGASHRLRKTISSGNTKAVQNPTLVAEAGQRTVPGQSHKTDRGALSESHPNVLGADHVIVPGHDQSLPVQTQGLLEGMNDHPPGHGADHAKTGMLVTIREKDQCKPSMALCGLLETSEYLFSFS